MSYAEDLPETFLSLRRAAVRLGVPVAWLRAEADAGRVPCLRISRRLMFNMETVERALVERAKIGVNRSEEAANAI